MVPFNRISPEATRTGALIGDPALADTLPLLYARSVIEGLPPEWRTAVDLGAGTGDASAELLGRGLRVLAVEQDPSLAATLRRRFEAESRERRFQLEQGTVVDTDGTLADRLDGHGFREIGVARVAGNERQWPALSALINRRDDPPAILIFHVHADAGDVARGCIAFLWAHGYRTFDVFIKRGTDPVAAERFPGPNLPAGWRSCRGREMSSAFVAHHVSRSAEARRLSPRRFLSDYQVLKSQHLLRSALKEEAGAVFRDGVSGRGMDGLTTSRVRSDLRFDILSGGWSRFLGGRIGRHLGAKAAWGARQERQRSTLAASRFGRQLIERLPEPKVGTTVTAPPGAAAGLSVPMTAALHDMMRLYRHSDGRPPRRVVELAGGWGLGAYVYASVVPDVAYVIVDHPEALAIQHYFLTLSLPTARVTFAQTLEDRPMPGSILLAPTAWLRTSSDPLACQLLYSSKTADMLAPSLREAMWRFGGFGASNTCFGGDWAFEGEEIIGPPLAIAA